MSKWVAAYSDKPRSEKLLAKLMNEVYEGEYFEPSEDPLKVYLKEWIRTKKGNVAEKTYEQYLYFIRNYIIPYIGKIKLNKLKTGHIKAFYSDLSEQSTLSQGSIYRLHITLRNALNSAIEDGEIPANPAVYKDSPKNQKPKFIFGMKKRPGNSLNLLNKKDHILSFTLLL